MMSLGRVSRLILGGSASFSSVRACVLSVSLPAGSRSVPRLAGLVSSRRELSHVPVDDLVSGLTEEQIQVSNVGELSQSTPTFVSLN